MALVNVTVEIKRFNPELDDKPHWESYEVSVEPTDRVLDALHEVKAKHDGTLSLRRSCAHGVCGSDAMVINGANSLACLLLVKDAGDTIRVEPIRGLPVIKDLVVDMEPFFAQYRSVLPYLLTTDDPGYTERYQHPEDRERFDDTTKCILCAACTTSCPVFWGNSGYVGPAAIVNAHRFIFDSRDEGAAERLDILNEKSGVWRCRTAFNCSEACPRDIKVTQAIEEVKRAILYDRVQEKTRSRIPGGTLSASSILAAGEAGYQVFELGRAEWFWLCFSVATALLALVVGAYLIRGVLAADEGTDSMIDIAKSIQEGASAYLKRQFRTIAIIVVPLAVVVFFTSTAVDAPSVEELGRLGFDDFDGSGGLSQVASGVFRTLAFIAGCLMSGLTGYIGMSLAVRGNVRTAAAARTGSMPAALQVAFRTGGVAGMFTVGLGLLGATLIIMAFQNTSAAILIGFGFGGSLLALFLRVGGGIFTKAADVGADLVGKVEAGIPEDDPRNPATIADNVGDNVGDCAGMASDLFESYEVTLVASIILGVAAFASVYPDDPEKWVVGLIFPVIARALGVLASIIGIFCVRASDKDKSALAPINRGFAVASVLTILSTLAVALLYVGNDEGTVSNIGWRMFGAVLIGLILAQAASRLTEYFTSTEHKPVRDIAEAARTGPATTVLSGIASGLESSVWAIIAVAIAIGAAIGLGGGDINLVFYLVALTGMGMLATTGVVVAEDTFGPVADNAAGIAEMSGEFTGEAERIMVSLDAVGNTTKAVTKGFAISSAVIAAVALFASFIETIGEELPDSLPQVARDAIAAGGNFFDAIPINVADPKTFIGLLIGGSIAFMFSSLAIRAVGRTAGVVVQEVRRQFADGKIMSGEKRPDYGPVIDICTTASLRELATPALLAVLTPLIVGFGINYFALGAFLAAIILTGQLMANYQNNAGGAWDNAKKYIEDGHEGGKGSSAHEAAVIGDTVGDPFKDTAGPALNPLIKVMNLVALLVLPAIIALEDNDPARYTIAGVCLVILLAAIFWSKRDTGGLDAEVEIAKEAGDPAPASTG